MRYIYIYGGKLLYSHFPRGEKWRKSTFQVRGGDGYGGKWL